MDENDRKETAKKVTTGIDSRQEDQVADSTQQPLADTLPTDDEGLGLLERVRAHRVIWPADDPTLDESIASEALLEESLEWGSQNTPPKTLGRFKIHRELGRGGFGVVLLADDPKLRQPVALKIPRVETLISEEARERMAREARAATILAHPGIVPVYETGRLGTIPYISYGYCEGDTLSHWLASNGDAIPPRRAAAIVARLAEAVQHAHARGIIHRDLKPSNILLASEDGNGLTTDSLVERLRICDFGLARVDSPEVDITKTGAAIGTPAYMSPEQVGGRNQITPASDIFALGVILYELLVGVTPFRRNSDPQTYRAIEAEEPPPLRSRTKIAKDLEAICFKCLEKRAGDRYATAQALTDDLQRFLRDEPVVARPVPAFYRLARWSRRNTALSLSLVSLSLVLVFATAFSLMMWSREQAARTLAEQKEEQATVAAQEAHEKARMVRQIVNEMLVDLRNVPSVDAKALAPFRKKLLTSYRKQMRGEDSSDPVIQAEFMKTLEDLATMHRIVGEHQTAQEMWEEAIDYVQTYRPDDFGKQAYFLALLSGELKMLGETKRSIEVANEGLAMQRAAVEQNPNTHVGRLLIGQLANACETVADANPEQAEKYIDEAIGLASTSLRNPPRDWPATRFWNALLTDKVKTAAILEKADTAAEFAQVAKDHIEQLLPQDRSYCLNQLSLVHGYMGHLHFQRRELPKAVEEYRNSIRLRSELSKRHPDIGLLQTALAGVANGLAEALIAAGSHDEALDHLNKNRERIRNGRIRFPQCKAEWDDAEKECDRMRLKINHRKSTH